MASIRWIIKINNISDITLFQKKLDQKFCIKLV